MKERPMLFSGPMVRAILEGRKSQTRRIVKFPKANSPAYFLEQACEIGPAEYVFFSRSRPGNKLFARDVYEPGDGIRCPYGEPGDRLWVRETFRPVMPYYGASGEVPDWVNYEYRADLSQFEDSPLMRAPLKWKPSIFMPREASRILLEITDVRVERLQDISCPDTLSEGVGILRDDYALADDYTDGEDFFPDPVEAFASLWGKINGPDSWDANPWVWVITFKKIEP